MTGGGSNDKKSGNDKRVAGMTKGAGMTQGAGMTKKGGWQESGMNDSPSCHSQLDWESRVEPQE